MIHDSMYIKSNVVKETPTQRRLTDGALCRAYQRGDVNAGKCLSLDMETNEGRNIADTILGGDVRDEINPDADLLRRHIADLPPRERQVIRLCFGVDCESPQNLRMIGEAMGVTHERVRQLRDVGLARLRKVMDRDDWRN